MRFALRHLRFAAALVAMLGGMWAAVDLHTHPTGLHAPTVCHVCDLEKGLSGGFAPIDALAIAVFAVLQAANLPERQALAVIAPESTRIRAPPAV